MAYDYIQSSIQQRAALLVGLAKNQEANTQPIRRDQFGVISRGKNTGEIMDEPGLRLGGLRDIKNWTPRCL